MCSFNVFSSINTISSHTGNYHTFLTYQVIKIAHKMHRRTNSYSYTASELGKLQPPPVLSKRYSNSHCIEELQRNTEERRSYRKSTANLLGNRGYRSLKVSQAFPATVRFSVNTEDLFLPLPDMYRPRSPTKSPKTKQDTFCVPVLDNALTAIKDQLVSV